MKIKCNVLFKDIDNDLYDAVISPGGMPGAKNLANNQAVVKLIKEHFEKQKLVGAICASPGLVLAEACGIMKDKNGCGYPGFDQKIREYGGNVIEDKNVVVDGNVITSRGPGTSLEFAIALVKELFGSEKANEIAIGTLLH